MTDNEQRATAQSESVRLRRNQPDTGGPSINSSRIKYPLDVAGVQLYIRCVRGKKAR
jgi:hypothetical protein